VPITVYTKTTCAPCQTLKYWLKSKNVQYEEKNLDKNPELLSELVDKTGMMMVPVVQIGDEIIQGLNLPLLSQKIVL